MAYRAGKKYKTASPVYAYIDLYRKYLWRMPANQGTLCSNSSTNSN